MKERKKENQTSERNEYRKLKDLAGREETNISQIPGRELYKQTQSMSYLTSSFFYR